MEKAKKLKNILIILIIIVIAIIAIITMLLSKTKEKVEEKQNTEISEKEPERYDNGFTGITDPGMYITIQNIVGNYYLALSLDVNSENAFLIRTQEEKNQLIYNMLDNSYIEENEITTENIAQKLSVENYNGIIPLQTRIKQGESDIQVLAHIGLLHQTEISKSLEHKMFLVKLDMINDTFSITPLPEDNLEINTIQVQTTQQRITANNNNKYDLPIVSTSILTQQYLANYKNLALYSPETVYNNCFTEEYKQKRFGSLENFIKYVNLNKEEIEQIQFAGYKIENEGEYTKYIIQDQYQNTYQFLERYIMEYTVMLDEYTIPSQEIINKYNNASETEKVALNVNKIISMINDRDFSTLYSLLDETYKNTYFQNSDEFDYYMRNMYGHVTYEISNSIKERDTYVIDVNLKNISNSNSVIKEMKIMMQLKNNMDFKISFEYINPE